MNDDLVKRALMLLTEASALLRAVVSEEPNLESNPAADLEFLDTPVTEIDLGPGLTARFRNMVNNHQASHWNGSTYEYLAAPLVTVRDIARLSEAEFLRNENVGFKTLQRVKTILKDHGLRFGMNV